MSRTLRRLAPLVVALVTLAVTAPAAHAFCGFYVGGAGAELFNNATQVVLMRHGTTTVLSMQNNYQGPPQGFALIIPVPVVVKEDQVKTLPREVFAKIDTLGAPRLVEYWEQDPCWVEPPYEREEYYELAGAAPTSDSADAGGCGDYPLTLEAPFPVEQAEGVLQQLHLVADRPRGHVELARRVLPGPAPLGAWGPGARAGGF